MNKQTILITGVAGLLGSRLAEYILENKPDYRVVGIDDMSGGYESNIPDGVTFYKTNITDGKLAEVFSKEKPNYVYHFAAYAAEGLSPFIRCFNYIYIVFYTNTKMMIMWYYINMRMIMNRRRRR